MTDRRLHTLPAQQQPTPIQSVVREHADDDGVRWLVGVMAELSWRFLGHAIKRFPELGRGKHQCPHCGKRS